MGLKPYSESPDCIVSPTPSASAEDCSGPVGVGWGIVYVLTVVPMVLTQGGLVTEIIE